MEIDMTREEAIKELRGFIGQLTEGCQEAIKVLIPELAESEDERTRKELLEVIRHCYEDGGYTLCTDDYKKYSDYLEKQKDSPMPEDSVVFQKGVAEGRRLEREDMEKKRGPIIETYQRSWYTEGYYDGKLKKEPRWIIKTQGICPKFEENPKYGQSLEEEQKPLPGFDDLTPDEKMNHPLYLEGFDTGREVGRIEAEQKPEWSEEEKRQLNRIYAILGQAADTHAYSTSCRLIGDKEAVELQDFLRSIAKPQIPEWSKEDEAIYDSIIREIVDKDMAMTNLQKRWLRSLKNRGSNTNSPSWKPSDEQMGLFGRIVNDLKIKMVGVTIKEHHTLESLYDDLKKLM